MKCHTTTNLLQQFIDGSLSATDAELVSSHQKECANCRQEYQDALYVIETLKDFSVPPASAGFADRVIKGATKPELPSNKSVLPYIASGIAASFIFLFILASAFFNPDLKNQSAPIVLIGNEIKTIKVAIESARTVDGIKMTIDLSDNLEISGYQNQRNISWNTRLEKGTNIIALPISAIAQGEGEITARVRLQDSEKIYKIRTRHQSPDNVSHDSQYYGNA